MEKDKIYLQQQSAIQDFDFDESVATVFDDMLFRSVPLYDEIQRMIIELTKSFVQPNTSVYDLGCATGTTICAIAKNIDPKNINIIGVDNSLPMLENARNKLIQSNLFDKATLLQADLNAFDEITNASVVILNLTLQFVRPLYRDLLISTVYKGLREQGCLILIEKILGESSMLNRLFVDYYYNFKRTKGYSELEISQKREALENVLTPYKHEENITLLKRNGFEIIDTFFKWYNFSGLLAVK